MKNQQQTWLFYGIVCKCVPKSPTGLFPPKPPLLELALFDQFKDVQTPQNRSKTGHWKATARVWRKILMEIPHKNLQIKGGYMISKALQIMHPPCDFRMFIFSQNPPGSLPVATARPPDLPIKIWAEIRHVPSHPPTIPFGRACVEPRRPATVRVPGTSKSTRKLKT